MNDGELEIFQRRKKEKTQKLVVEWDDCSNTLVEPDKEPVKEEPIKETSVAPTSRSPDSDDKRSALEIVLGNLRREYHFINCNRQLYVCIYEEGYWKLIPSSNSNYELRSLIPADTKSMAMRVNFTALYDWLLSEAEVVGEEFFPDNWKYINFRDCAVNWKNGKIKTNRKKYNFRYALQIDYVRGKSSGEFGRFIKEIFGEDKATRKEFYKYIALCLSSIRRLKYCGFLLGPSHSGKSTVLSVLKYVLGAENCSSLSFSQISNNEFALTQLQGKRLNLSGEVSGVTNKKIDILKSITGNDLITASYKCRDHFQFDSSMCMLVFACNSLPRLDSYLEMESFLSRVVIFPFANPKPRSEWDKNLFKKLISDTEGIIQCLMKGLKLLKDADYQIFETQAMKECKLEYAGVWESFSSFCNKYIVKDVDGKLTSSEIQEVYHQYCNQNDMIELYSNQWVQVLKNKYLCTSCTKTLRSEEGETTRVRAYKGIAFSSNVDKLMQKQTVEENCSIRPAPDFF